MIEKMKKIFEKTEEEFKKRYDIKPVLKLKEREGYEKAFLKLMRENVVGMRKSPNRAKAMRYYDEIVKFKRAAEIRKSGKKIVGYFCNFVPEELIYAAGAIPIRLCSGFYDAIHPAEEVLPKDICPLIKSSLGCKILGLPYFGLCDVVVVPTSCDGKKKLAEVLSDYLPVWVLELPNSKDREQSKDLWLNEVKLLKERIERLTGNEITKERLKKAIEVLHKRTEIFHKLYKIRNSEVPVISGRDALLVTQASFYDDTNKWIKQTEKLCKELERNIAKDKGVCSSETTRLLLTGSPIIWPNYKLLNIIEESNAVIIIDDLCSGTQHLYEPVEIDEYSMKGMLKAIAERYLLPSICPCFVSSDDRIDRVLQLMEEFNVDGVVYHALRLCQLYDMEANKIKKILESKGIAMLKIQTDYSQEDVEQIRTRVEAFLEMIKSRKVVK